MYVSTINFCATEILTNFKKKTKSNQYLGMKVNLIFIFKNIEKIFFLILIFNFIFFFRFIDSQRQFFKEKPS